MKKSKSQKNRGKFLTAMLILSGISLITTNPFIPNPSTQRIFDIYSSVPWHKGYYIIYYFIAIATLIGIFLWKKIAAYTLFTTAVLNFIITNFILKPYYSPYINIVAWLISTSIWFWAIKRKWQLFE